MFCSSLLPASALNFAHFASPSVPPAAASLLLPAPLSPFSTLARSHDDGQTMSTLWSRFIPRQSRAEPKSAGHGLLSLASSNGQPTRKLSSPSPISSCGRCGLAGWSQSAARLRIAPQALDISTLSHPSSHRFLLPVI